MSMCCIGQRYQQYIAVIFIFFFLNVYLLYNTASDSELTTTTKKLSKQSQERADFQYLKKCEITDDLALSAIRRAKSNKCKAKIEEAACLIQNGKFHDYFPASTCNNHDESLIDHRMGCFRDQKGQRILKEFEYKLPDTNSKEKCRRSCYKAGYIYYGVEYGLECFCGNSLNGTRLEDEECKLYKCPGNEMESCGGFNAIDVFRTGFKEEMATIKPIFVQNSTLPKKAKILFLLQLNGRNDRQVKRFLKSIYSPIHHYIIHVDKRQHFMYHEMSSISAKFPNIVLANKRFSTIWGGASLLEMFQEVIRESLIDTRINDWNYIINFSESDFPVLPLSNFEDLINENFGKSFLASHGYNTGRFIQKQGFEYIFLECEERMWRIGKREFPSNLRIDGGSDWVGIHRDLALFSISNDELPRKLRKLYTSILLPLESFYHTLSLNSRFCRDVLSSNLRLTNWYRKQGCRCAGLKKVVDWCGCSPLVFRNDTVQKFDNIKAKAKPSYFARKFDSIVNINAIHLAEEQAVEEAKISKDHPSYNSAFANVYKHEVDGDSFAYFNMAKAIAKIAEIGYDVKLLKRIDIFKARSSAPIQIVINVDTNNGEYQFLVARVAHLEILSHVNVNGYRLQNLTYGSKFEYKEEICREYTGVITNSSIVQVKMEWSRSEEAEVRDQKITSPELRIKWIDSRNKLISEKNVKAYDSVFGGQFAEIDLSNIDTSRIPCGEYKAEIYPADDNSESIGSIHFPVFPSTTSSQKTECYLNLTRRFYDVIDSCKSNECSEKIWSTSFPDPKSDINVGYDPVSGKIV